MQLNILKEWFTNFGTVFSILGFFATIYLGVFYVPTWLKESQNEKIRNAENEIFQSIKEIVYSDSTLTISELTSLVHAKEISLKEEFPHSLSDILAKTQASFMEDKFLPLPKRLELIKEIEEFKERIPKKETPVNGKQVEGKKGVWWYSLFSILGAILAVILGILSFYEKYLREKNKDEEITNEIEEVNFDAINTTNQNANSYERGIIETLRKHNGVSIIEESIDKGVDAVFSKGEKQFYIEVKYLNKSKIGLKSFQKLANYLEDKSGEAWLVYNTDLTPLVEKSIENYNKINKHVKIKAIRAVNSNEFASKFSEILHD